MFSSAISQNCYNGGNSPIPVLSHSVATSHLELLSTGTVAGEPWKLNVNEFM